MAWSSALTRPLTDVLSDDMARLILQRIGDQTIGALCRSLAGEFGAPLDTGLNSGVAF